VIKLEAEVKSRVDYKKRTYELDQFVPPQGRSSMIPRISRKVGPKVGGWAGRGGRGKSTSLGKRWGYCRVNTIRRN